MEMFRQVQVAIGPSCRHPTQIAFPKIDSRCVLSQAVRHQNGMIYLLNFGESGKNFIEIGKRPKGQETMLRLAVP
jgi:hypothetical protein